MLSHPHLVQTQAVHQHDQIKVTFQRQRRVLTGIVERGEKGTEAHLSASEQAGHVGKVQWLCALGSRNGCGGAEVGEPGGDGELKR